MGRTEYLIRLALGRSPYHSTDAESNETATLSGPLPSSSTDGDASSSQQYHSRTGRPINPVTEAKTAEMRKAQNSILALFNVVEDRERTSHAAKFESRGVRKTRQQVLRAEHDRGDDLDLVVSLLSPVVGWWADTLLQRFQVGYYDAKTSFTSVVRMEFTALVSTGLKGFLGTLVPGLSAYTIHLLARVLLFTVVEEGTGEFQEHIISLNGPGRKTARNLCAALDVLCAVLLLAIDLALLPLDFHSTVQQLGLAPAFPLFPPLTAFLPWHSNSIHGFGWAPVLAVPFLRSFCSPASLLLLRAVVKRDTDATTPACADFTSFRYPPINNVPRTRPPALIKDPFGYALHACYRVRTAAMHWCGWRVVRNKRAPLLEQDVSHDHHGANHVHRSTALAHLPAHFLSIRIDELLQRLLVFPLESLTLRMVAFSFVQSPFSKTWRASALVPYSHAPFSGGIAVWPLMSGRSDERLGGFICYASKIGLCFALQVAIQSALFAGVYTVTRWYGTRLCAWGNKNGTARLSAEAADDATAT